MVGVKGFEPAAPCSQSTCATKLRHTPAREAVPHKQQSDYTMNATDVSIPYFAFLGINGFLNRYYSVYPVRAKMTMRDEGRDKTEQAGSEIY